MNAQSKIKEYINNHDFVMLPGIGAFLAEYTKPYLTANGEIVNPKRKIRFNPELRDDSDIDILKNKLNLSETEIQQDYFNLLDEIDDKIAKNGTFHWDGLGIFSKPAGILQFVDLSNTEDRDFAKNLNSEILEKKESVLETSKPQIQFREIPQTEPVESITLDESRLSEPNNLVETKAEPNVFLRFLIFAIPLLVLVGALIYTVFLKPSAQKQVKETPEFIEEGFENAQIDTLYQEEVIEETLVAEPQTGQIILRVGVYKKESDANIIASTLKKSAYETAEVSPHGKLFKVSVRANSEEEADKYIDKIEQLLGDRPIYER